MINNNNNSSCNNSKKEEEKEQSQNDSKEDNISPVNNLEKNQVSEHFNLANTPPRKNSTLSRLPTLFYTSTTILAEEGESEVRDFSLTSVERESLSKYTQIRYNKDSMVSPEYSDEEEKENENIIYFEEEKEHIKYIHYMSINLFIKKIALEKFTEDKNNKPYIEGFIEQYPSFLKVNILVEKLIKAFVYYWFKDKIEVPELIMFLNKILLTQYEKIKECEELKEVLIGSYQSLLQCNWIKDEIKKDVQSIIYLFNEEGNDKFEENFVKYSIFQRKRTNKFTLSSNNIVKKHSKNFFNLNDWTEEEIAKQLTFISFVSLASIEDEEIISAKFAKKDKEKNSPNIMKMINRFDKMILFIIEDILSYDKKSKRAKMIEKWVKIALKCKEMNNFTDCMIINTTFYNYILKGLTKTWEKVSKETKNDIEELKRFCTCQKSYINIREAINIALKAKSPYVPYLGLLLKEISYFEEKMDYIKDDSLINFQKIRKVSLSIKKFKQFNRFGYFVTNNEGLEILDHLDPKTDEELSKYAEMLEPKFKLKKKSGKKRLTKTDQSYYLHE